MLMLEISLAIVGVLLSVAFFTLAERKIMGLMHYRKGPNKVLMSGVSQPIADAAKLLTKENPKFSHTKATMYLLGPAISLFVMLCCWVLYNFTFGGSCSSLKILVIMSIMGLGCYGMIFMSWGSNSKYALLGGYRSLAQVISYEVCLMLFTLTAIYMTSSYSMNLIQLMQQNMWFAMFFPPLLLIWLAVCMAESNRTPFDLAEGESELVSGFNVEYGGGLFALIFISEYGMILVLSFLTSVIFLGTTALLVKTFLVSLIFIWTRCSFPRVRWDSLMSMSWKMALPLSIGSLMMMTLM